MQRRRLEIVVVALIVILGVAVGPSKIVTGASTWIARLKPVSVRAVKLTASDREAFGTVNANRFVVLGRVPPGATLECWVEVYHQGVRVEQDIARLAVPITRQGATFLSVQEAISANGHWVHQSWTLIASAESDSRLFVDAGTFPVHMAKASMSGQASGPLDLSQGEAVALYVAAYGDQGPDPMPPQGFTPGPGGILSEGVMAMDFVYVLKAMVVAAK